MYTQNDLIDFKPAHPTFVGIDSDGCVFDSMGAKQRICFHPLIIDFWDLQSIEKELRETAEFVNLYSKWRGTNRFQALSRVFEMLPQRSDLKDVGIELPPIAPLKEFVESGKPLSNEGLEKEAERTGDAELKKLLAWSLKINEDIEEKLKRIPPFDGVVACLEKMKPQSDLMVVSQTPVPALIKEWDENKIRHFVEVIAGQELGTKAEHLKLATGGKYEATQVLMIGDAPGDRKAAEAVDALFYPINPGHEEASWKRLGEEAYDLFLAGEYAGAYQDERIAEFEGMLPETPPWDTI